MISEKEMQSETSRAANAIDRWELPKKSLEAKRAALRFGQFDANRKMWFWLYYSKIMARIRAEGVE